MRKFKYPRSFYYKVYKIMCKMFNCSAICWGPVMTGHSKKSMKNAIYVESFAYGKVPVVAFTLDENRNIYAQSCMLITMRKSELRDTDMQKAIVMKLMKVLEHCSLRVEDMQTWNGHVIEQGIEWEKLVIDADLKRGMA